MKTADLVFLAYLALISILSVVVTVHDKIRAREHGWRVPENVLLLLSALGGSAAMYGTMLLIRHKTQHSKFMLGIPIIFLFQLVLLLYCCYKGWGIARYLPSL